MRRRALITTLPVVAVAGCTAPDSTPTETDGQPTATHTDTVTANPDDPILFVVDNDTDTEQTVQLTLTDGDRTLIDDSVTLSPDGSREYDPEIGTPGEYDLSVAVDGGPSTSRTLDIEAFDVRAGSNHFIDITDDSIDVFWEE